MRNLIIGIALIFSASLANAEQNSAKTNGIANQLAALQKSDFEIARSSMSQSKPETIMRVADLYRLGFGTPKNMKEAFRYYSEASRLNYAPAQERIAQLYLNGEGVKEDKEKGIQWLIRAAKNGSYEAMTHLSVRYQLGIGVIKNDFEAKLWSSRANTAMKKAFNNQALITPSTKPARKSEVKRQNTNPAINPSITPKKQRYNDYGLDRL